MSDTGDASAQLPAPSAVNPEMMDSVNQTLGAVFGKVSAAGDGIAYQKVAQAAAFAIQDATDYLRNVMTMATTAQGTAMKLFMETKDASYLQVVAQAQTMVTQAKQDFQDVGSAASGILTAFPKS